MKHSLAIVALVLMTTQAGAVSLMPSAKDEHKVSENNSPEYTECNGKFGQHSVKGLKCSWEAFGVIVERRRAEEAKKKAEGYSQGNPKRKLFEAESQYHEAQKTYRRERMNKLLGQ